MKIYEINTTLRIAFFMVLINQYCYAQNQRAFSSINQILEYAKQTNYSIKSATIQNKLAELTKKAAIANVINPRIPSSIQLLDNTKQQVIFLPGDAFGQPGSFRSVTTGQKYSALLNFQPQFEILNLAGKSQAKASVINQSLTENQNQLNEFDIFNQINTIYYNILSYQGQIEIVKENIELATNILKIAENKFKEQVGRKQEVNEAEVNLINLQSNLEQLDLNLKIQKEALALFFENTTEPILSESLANYEEEITVKIESKNSLLLRNAELQLQKIKQDINTDKAQNYPTVSFISSFNWQNLSNNFFFNATSNSIGYNYIGLKVNYDLPTTVTKYANIKNKNLQSEILKNSYLHAQNEAETSDRKMMLELEKAKVQLKNYKKITDLKSDTYQKSLNQYKENILSLDVLLNSYNSMLAAKLNVVTALANIGFCKNRIDINNKF